MNIAFIPVRCGSKSIPLKNIKSFCGEPLIYWSLKELENAQYIDKIYVATDCDTIEKVVLNYKFKKVEVYRREPSNATDLASTESVMAEFINKQNFNDTDLLVLVQATSPFTQANDFDRGIELLKSTPNDSLLTCARIKRFFWNENGTPLNYNYKHRPRRQDFQGVLIENGAFYINSIRNIKRDNNRLSGKIAIYEMPEYTSIELDEEDDWNIAESLMKKYVLKNTNPKSKIKLFVSDVDGTLTNAGMYYSANGEELKRFNTRDGKGFELLNKAGIKTAIITSETTKIVEKRAEKLNIDYLYQGVEHQEKLEVINEICKKENIFLHEVAFIGDDINDKEALENVGLAGCPSDAVEAIKKVAHIQIMSKNGGEGAVREFISLILEND